MKQHAPGFIKISEDAKSRIAEISVQEVKNKIDQQECFYLIDVREDSEWQQGYLPTAIHLSKGIIERDIEAKIADLKTPIVLYCGGGYRSAMAADNLQKMGYNQVKSMAGGFSGWIQAGFEVIK